MAYTDRETQRAYQREFLQRRRRAWIAEHGPCKRCGSREDLQVDHVDPSTKAAPISSVWSWAEPRRLAELAKCQVLCGTCHLAKTLDERPKTDHGRLWMYQKGCRCEPCREAKRGEMTRNRRRVA
jgi:5-methylcytosine-specific restriction endonuclease McrA